MKIKNTIIISILILPMLLRAQTRPVQHRLSATTETEMYHIYEQLLDSTIDNRKMSFGYVESFRSKDTLMKIEQYCYWYGGFPEQYICEPNRYNVFITNSMSIAFYERFVKYLESLNNTDNLFYKYYSVRPLYTTRKIIIKKFEFEKLTKDDSLKALELIEQITLRIVKDAHSYNFLYGSNEYMTESIHQALINVIEHPFYPESYLDFYLSEVVDTNVLDTTGIPNEIKKKYVRWKGLYSSGNLDYDLRLAAFYNYKRMGDELGLTPGQAYLKEKEKVFPEKGYLNINVIADYAFKNQDSIIIEHLKEFKKKHPDYPLRHF